MTQYLTYEEVTALRASFEKSKPILASIPDGYYALPRDDSVETDFFAVSHPTKGKYRDTLKVRSLHGEKWQVELSLQLSSTFHDVYCDPRWLTVLRSVVGDLSEAQRRYARLKERCCVCNTGLTVERSRYYGIGPECEGRHQDIIDLVDEQLGEYYPGKMTDDEIEAMVAGR